MHETFQFEALQATRFSDLFSRTDAELHTIGVKRMAVKTHPGVPCRVSFEDAQVGETVILMPFVHLDTDSPYRASGPIFVRQDAATAGPEPGVVPALLTHRLLSLRAYDRDAMMRNATTAEGVDAPDAITTLFADARVHTIHVHNAQTGCYLAKVVRSRC